MQEGAPGKGVPSGVVLKEDPCNKTEREYLPSVSMSRELKVIVAAAVVPYEGKMLKEDGEPVPRKLRQELPLRYPLIGAKALSRWIVDPGDHKNTGNVHRLAPEKLIGNCFSGGVTLQPQN